MTKAVKTIEARSLKVGDVILHGAALDPIRVATIDATGDTLLINQGQYVKAYKLKKSESVVIAVKTGRVG